MNDGATLQREHGGLWDFLRKTQDEIISRWTRQVRTLSPVHELSDSAIVDHLPQILALIAEYVETVHTGESVSLEQLAKAHALDRLGRGFDFDQIVTEYALLRRTILDLCASRLGPSIDLTELRTLESAIDDAVGHSARRYAHAREKLLKALDRVSEAALTSANLDAFLEGLLRATVDGTESVDVCVVLLRHGDVLRVRAAVGIEEDLQGFSLPVGEGFAGHIAADGSPAFVRDASTDPVVATPPLRAQGVHAMYGVPMVREGQVIGVAYIGSTTAFEFSDEDKLLFRTMVTRATSGIVKGQLLADLHQALAARNQVLAIVSHDLRNHLGVIATGAELVARSATGGQAGGDVIKRVDTIRRTTTTMQRLLDDLLDLASLEAGRLSFEPDVLDLGAVIEESCQTHEDSARAKGLQLKVAPGAQAIAVRADQKRIVQVLSNLVGNAIKFSSPGGAIVVGADAGAREVTVSVKDSGPGIPPEDLHSIFEAYNTRRRSTKSGTGLGLSIARGIVQRHGGRIWAESELGQGATFFFTLPRATDEA